MNIIPGPVEDSRREHREGSEMKIRARILKESYPILLLVLLFLVWELRASDTSAARAKSMRQPEWLGELATLLDHEPVCKKGALSSHPWQACEILATPRRFFPASRHLAALPDRRTVKIKNP